MIIAIDGPAASGKGTLARRLAERLGCALLDTGRITSYNVCYTKLLRAAFAGGEDAAGSEVAGDLGGRFFDELGDEGDFATAEARLLVHHVVEAGVEAALVQLFTEVAAAQKGAHEEAVDQDGRGQLGEAGVAARA